MAQSSPSMAAMSEAAMSEIPVIALVYERTAYAGFGLMLARNFAGTAGEHKLGRLTWKQKAPPCRWCDGGGAHVLSS